MRSQSFGSLPPAYSWPSVPIPARHNILARTQRRPTAPRCLSLALPMPWSNLRTNPSSSFASEWRQARRRRCTTLPAQGWWCGSPTRTCATRIPTAARMRRIATRGTSTGSACNGTRARISRMRRWNFWRSCPRQVGRPPRRNSSRAANRLSRRASQLGTRSDAPFADKTHVRPPPSRPKQNHIVFFGLAALHPGRADRHAGNGKAGCIRFLGKEELQRCDRDVPLDDITRDLRGVAGGEIVWNAEPFLHRIDVVGVEYLGDETRLLKMLDPT